MGHKLSYYIRLGEMQVSNNKFMVENRRAFKPNCIENLQQRSEIECQNDAKSLMDV